MSGTDMPIDGITRLLTQKSNEINKKFDVTLATIDLTNPDDVKLFTEIKLAKETIDWAQSAKSKSEYNIIKDMLKK
jgi:hypothetical protein